MLLSVIGRRVAVPLGSTLRWFSSQPVNLATRTRLMIGQSIRRLVHSTPKSSATLNMSAEAVQIDASQKAVGYWLLSCAGLVFGAVVLGGVTRLTESGLSMVKWHPAGGMPPQTQEEWLAEFEDYKQFPEYKYSAGMTLDDFKRIFYMEYFHRMWGRMVGVAFIVPGAYFLFRGRFKKSMRVPLLLMTGFLGFQGFMGWYMVRSGLEYDPQGKHVPRVSQYRLAAHLGTAFILYVLYVWHGLSHVLKPHAHEITAGFKRLRSMAHFGAMMVFFTAMSGAFVAGMDAGLIYNEFPLMGDRWIPSDIFSLSPWWKNFFEDPTTAQFDHRYMGITTGLLVSAIWLTSRRIPLPSRTKMAANAFLGMVGVQIGLGIATLIYLVPTEIAATHQAGSLTLLTFAIWLLHELRKAPK